ncbi:MAG: hypothetical protein CM15mP129_00430 [Chloroflexota bacterium]|nr:MAG: hypothetical protein CM15mP129_00430 [Chloroflexota bacterium]
MEPGTLYYITIFIFCPTAGQTSDLPTNAVNFVTLDSACPDPENISQFDPTADGFDIMDLQVNIFLLHH